MWSLPMFEISSNQMKLVQIHCIGSLLCTYCWTESQPELMTIQRST